MSDVHKFAVPRCLSIALRQVQDRYKYGQKYFHWVHCVFSDLKKSYDMIQGEELYWCMRDKGFQWSTSDWWSTCRPYHQCETVVRCAAGTSEPFFAVEVGLHQESAFSPLQFVIVTDSLSVRIRIEAPWQTMFTDCVVLCASHWAGCGTGAVHGTLEMSGMRVIRVKTQYMCLHGTPAEILICHLPGFHIWEAPPQTDGDMNMKVNKRTECGRGLMSSGRDMGVQES